MFGGPVISGPLRCFTCLKEVSDFNDLEEHHIKEHHCEAKNAPIPKWTKWRRLKLAFMDWQWCRDYNRKRGSHISYDPLWWKIIVVLFFK